MNKTRQRLPSGKPEENGMKPLGRTAEEPPPLPEPAPELAGIVVAEAGCYIRWARVQGGFITGGDVIRADIDLSNGQADMLRDLTRAAELAAGHLEKMRRGEV